MAISINQLLAREQVTRVVTTIAVPQDRFQRALGMQPGGPNTSRTRGHYFAFDLIDPTRKIATIRAPGSPPGTVQPKIMGHVPVTLCRSHEKKNLLDSRIFLLRPLGAQYGEVDEGGARYITREQTDLAARLRNLREFMISRMFRGSFQVLQNGDDWIPVDSGGTFTVNYQIPAGNTLKLNMLGAGDIIGTSWDNAAADIIGDILSINAANEQLHGRPVRHLWISSIVFGHMLNNTGLKAAGGTSNTVWEMYRPDGLSGPDGMESTGFTIIFRAIPWLKVHVYDAGLEVGTAGTYTKFVDDTHAIFTPEMGPDVAEMIEGSEPQADNVMDRGREVWGMNAWTERKTQPPSWELIGLDNALPVLYQPKTVQYATVVY